MAEFGLVHIKKMAAGFGYKKRMGGLERGEKCDLTLEVDCGASA